MLLNTFYHTVDSRVIRISANAPKLKVIHNNNIDSAVSDLNNFERLYDNYAPKAYGFITKHTNSKEQAEEYMMNVFLKVWENIKTFDHEAEKKIQHIVITTCRSIYKQIA